MDMGNSSGQMAITTKENFLRIISQAKVFTRGLMAGNTQARGSITRCMAMVN